MQIGKCFIFDILKLKYFCDFRTWPVLVVAFQGAQTTATTSPVLNFCDTCDVLWHITSHWITAMHPLLMSQHVWLEDPTICKSIAFPFMPLGKCDILLWAMKHARRQLMYSIWHLKHVPIILCHSLPSKALSRLSIWRSRYVGFTPPWVNHGNVPEGRTRYCQNNSKAHKACHGFSHVQWCLSGGWIWKAGAF